MLIVILSIIIILLGSIIVANVNRLKRNEKKLVRFFEENCNNAYIVYKRGVPVVVSVITPASTLSRSEVIKTHANALIDALTGLQLNKINTTDNNITPESIKLKEYQDSLNNDIVELEKARVGTINSINILNKALNIVNDDAALVDDAREIVAVSQGTSKDKEQMAKDLAEKSKVLQAKKNNVLEVINAETIISK